MDCAIWLFSPNGDGAFSGKRTAVGRLKARRGLGRASSGLSARKGHSSPFQGTLPQPLSQIRIGQFPHFQAPWRQRRNWVRERASLSLISIESFSSGKPLDGPRLRADFPITRTTHRLVKAPIPRTIFEDKDFATRAAIFTPPWRKRRNGAIDTGAASLISAQ